LAAATALLRGHDRSGPERHQAVLAYSTVSQLGYMFLAMGVGAFGAASSISTRTRSSRRCCFLGSGAVIHALHGEQDLRNMGGLKKELPITYWTFLIGAIAIAGVTGLAGFFSKDEILAQTYFSGHTVLWVDRGADGAIDRLLHVPARIPRVPWCAAVRAGRWPRSRS
jgi:NADH-quinone oxidoreductase subunit L